MQLSSTAEEQIGKVGRVWNDGKRNRFKFVLRKKTLPGTGTTKL